MGLMGLVGLVGLLGFAGVVGLLGFVGLGGLEAGQIGNPFLLLNNRNVPTRLHREIQSSQRDEKY